MRLYTQDFQSFPQSNEFVERASRPLRKPKKRKLRKCREDDSDPYLAMLALRTTKNSSGNILLRVADEKNVANATTFAKSKCKH